jgi:hypothetical protein
LAISQPTLVGVGSGSGVARVASFVPTFKPDFDTS